jgi:hypothetical protein
MRILRENREKHTDQDYTQGRRHGSSGLPSKHKALSLNSSTTKKDDTQMKKKTTMLFI